jgi:hypothetical protein
VKEPGFHIWGCSPILAPDGRVHLFVARWPESAKHYPGWHSQSEIARYVGDTPTGPFRYQETVLVGTGKDTWDKFAPHNPLIKKVGDQYALFYIANRFGEDKRFVASQRIGLALAPSLEGPWRKAGKDGLILAPSEHPEHWTHGAFNGVNNPAFIVKDGAYYLYFKSADRKMGLSIANHLEGPYVMLPHPVTHTDRQIEDGYAFEWNDEICLLTTDNHGTLKRGGGILWRSASGIEFRRRELGFDLMDKYIPRHLLLSAVNPKHSMDPDSTGDRKFERPQVLMINGEPAYIYLASGTNILTNEDLGEVTVNYILRVKR